MSCVDVLQQGSHGPEVTLTQLALGGVPDLVVLRVCLQLLMGLEGKAALAASVLVHMLFRDCPD